MSNLLQNKRSNSIVNKIMGAVVGMNAFVVTALMTYASYGVWGNATLTITDIFTTLESALKSVVVPIAGCALVACFIMMLVSQNQKKVESYRGWCITIVICIVGIYAVPFIINLSKGIGQKF